MDTINYTTARAKLAKTMDRVNEDCAPVLITRQRGKPAVLMSLEEFEAWRETAHLLSSPRNARRLAEACREIDAQIKKDRRAATRRRRR